ncbi:MAG: fatty acid desaturase [Pseudomonadota bacterium]
MIPATKRRAEVSVVEWPTILLVIANYGVWFAAMIITATAAWGWIALPFLILATTLHASLQHEALHGHPTRNIAVNELLVFLPIGLFIPYRRMKTLHLRHHRDETLTDPYEDPESFYRPQAEWGRYSAVFRAILNANNTLVGRIVLGPALSLFGFWRDDAKLAFAGDEKVIVAWSRHLIGLAIVFAILVVLGVSLPLYILAVAYPAMSLLMVRTFAEHQADDDPHGRTVIVEKGGLWGFLFLNNHLHVVHHEQPRAPWYKLPSIYAADRERFHQKNGGYVVPSYGALFSAYAFRRKEAVPHPTV